LSKKTEDRAGTMAAKRTRKTKKEKGIHLAKVTVGTYLWIVRSASNVLVKRGKDCR